MDVLVCDTPVFDSKSYCASYGVYSLIPSTCALGYPADGGTPFRGLMVGVALFPSASALGYG